MWGEVCGRKDRRVYGVCMGGWSAEDEICMCVFDGK